MRHLPQCTRASRRLPMEFQRRCHQPHLLRYPRPSGMLGVHYYLARRTDRCYCQTASRHELLENVKRGNRTLPGDFERRGEEGASATAGCQNTESEGACLRSDLVFSYSIMSSNGTSFPATGSTCRPSNSKVVTPRSIGVLSAARATREVTPFPCIVM